MRSISRCRNATSAVSSSLICVRARSIFASTRAAHDRLESRIVSARNEPAHQLRVGSVGCGGNGEHRRHPPGDPVQQLIAHADLRTCLHHVTAGRTLSGSEKSVSLDRPAATIKQTSFLFPFGFRPLEASSWYRERRRFYHSFCIHTHGVTKGNYCRVKPTGCP
jgi:hypothetical protein